MTRLQRLETENVLSRLALKAFYSSKPSFPLMHVKTTWKFREVLLAKTSERQSCVIDRDDGTSMEAKKLEGHF